MSDVSERADDFDRRVREAGSTEGIISGLVEGAERSKRMINLMAAILVFLVLTSIAGATVTYYVWDQSRSVARNADNIATNTERLRDILAKQCLQDVTSAQSTNTILRVLIIGAGDPGVFSPQESKVRIERYTKALVPVPRC